MNKIIAFSFLLCAGVGFADDQVSPITDSHESLEIQSPNTCSMSERYFGTAYSSGRGLNENCNRALKTSADSALAKCFESGGYHCGVIYQAITSSNSSRCDATAWVMTQSPICHPPYGIFTAKGWARNYGSEDSNCFRATQVAQSAAINKCYRAGKSYCRSMFVHLVRSEGQTYCEQEAIVFGN
jgi:hypothetical protein